MVPVARLIWRAIFRTREGLRLRAVGDGRRAEYAADLHPALKREEAREFLSGTRGRLRPTVEFLSSAGQLGIAKTTLKRAKKDLGVVAKREGSGSEGRWSWSLPMP